MLLKTKVAAIEFAGDEVRVAVVKSGGKVPKVLELVSRRAVYEDPGARFEALVAALDEALSQLKTRPSAYVLCESSMFCIVRTLTIPFRGARRVASAVAFELEPHLALPIEDLLLDYSVVTEIDGETEVLAMGMRRNQIDDRLAILEAAGVEAEAVTLDTVAITGLWQASRRRQKGLAAVFHAREACSSLVILFNGKLAYFRHLACTARQVTEEPVVVAREVQNSIRAFLAKWRGEGEITELSVTGMSFSPEERDAFSAAVRLPLQDTVLVSQLKGGALALDGGPLGAKHNTWEAAIGAAHGASGGSLSIDFRQSEPNIQTVARGVITHAVFTACLTLMLLGGWALYYYEATARNEAEILRLDKEVAALKADIQGMQDKGLGADVNTDMFSDPSLIDLLKEIAGNLADDGSVILTDLKIAPPEAESAWMRISGSAPDAAQVNQFLDRLRKSKLFRLDEQADLNVQGDLTTFAVKAFRANGGKNETGT